MKTPNSNDEIKKQVIEAITGDYMLICLVDLAEDTYEVIQRSASPGYEMIVDGIYSRFSEEYNRKYVDEAFQDIRGKTGSIAFLSRALHDDPFVSCDFLMKDGQARRTVFKRFETDGERVTKAILYSYRLDRARTGRLIERRRLETEYSIIDGLCSDYSMISTIDTATGRFHIYKYKPFLESIRLYGDEESYNDTMRFFKENYVLKEDWASLEKEATLETILEKINAGGSADIVCRTVPQFHGGQLPGYARFRFCRVTNDPERIVFGARDITENVYTEFERRKELEQALNDAQEANQARSEFLFRMSHELHTPLNVILGFLDLAEKYPGDIRRQEEYLGHIRRSGKRLLELTDEMLDAAVSEGDKEKAFILREGQKKEEKAVLEQISLVGRRILLAEDNELNAEITMELLADEDILCEHAEDGAVCLQMLEDHDADHYDLILMDIQMPNLNGYEAARAIRALPDADKARIPILALSANYLPSDRTNALDAGMDDLVAKPIDVAELLKKLRKALRD